MFDVLGPLIIDVSFSIVNFVVGVSLSHRLRTRILFHHLKSGIAFMVQLDFRSFGLVDCHDCGFDAPTGNQTSGEGIHGLVNCGLDARVPTGLFTF